MKFYANFIKIFNQFWKKLVRFVKFWEIFGKLLKQFQKNFVKTLGKNFEVSLKFWEETWKIKNFDEVSIEDQINHF